MQAHGAGRRDELQRLAQGASGQRPGGRRYALEEEMGSGCDREVQRRQTAIDGGR